MLETLPLTCDAAVAAALEAVGRTEDVSFSPDGDRVAIAGFHDQTVLVVDLAWGDEAVEATGAVTIVCPEFRAPHGVAFADAGTLFVANRERSVLAVPVPPPGSCGRVQVTPSLDLSRVGAMVLRQPGSLTVVDSGLGLWEVLVCHNDGATVSRHVIDHGVDHGGELRLVAEEALLQRGLAVPDSAAVSNDGRWLAVSNHYTHDVLIYRNGPDLGPASLPVGCLQGMQYPHGLAFAGDDTVLFAADAGTPFVHVFAPAEWRGLHEAERVVRVKTDEEFLATHYNPREGGPKGLDVHHGRHVVALSSERQPLVLCSVDALVGRSVPPTAPAPDRGRDLALRALAGLASARAEIAEITAKRDADLAVLRDGWAELTERAESSERFLQLLLEGRRPPG